ncbi:MAG: TauD/TfdA family dioxygenase [Hyphomonadaceae bacterium]|nr:TauD/TfdA family dioxygenase [Hyphomonadaceae bacterium]
MHGLLRAQNLTTHDRNVAERALTITPSGAALGATVEGLDLREELAPGFVAALRAALVEHKVLFFHDQDISHEDHIRFGRYFGVLEGHPVTQHVEGHPEILSIRNGEYAFLNETTIPFIRAVNKWHADVTFRPAPSLAGLLRARIIPPRGGDTLFADMGAVYADLPADLRARLDGLTATHDILKSYGWKLSPEERETLSRKHPPRSHPVVRVHPESGERSIFVNSAFTTHIDGLSPSESEETLAFIYDRIRGIPEYQVRFKWSPNAIVFWDNRSTQHYPIADYWPHERVVERVTIVGDVPVGPQDDE